MTATRSRKQSILVVTNNIGGKVVDMSTLADGTAPVFDQGSNMYKHIEVAPASHDHELGDMTLIFENALI